MKKGPIQKAYNAKEFRERGHQLIDELAAHLEHSISGESEKVIRWTPPEDERLFWKEFKDNGDEAKLFQTILTRSIHVHHPKYIGHQVSLTAPITALSGMISALLNNGMAVYEMGMASTAIERVVIDWICAKIGYTDTSRGFLTSGGTLANLTALLSARKAKLNDDVWSNGHRERLGIMVSEEAHYCVDRAARIMGLGDSGIIKIPVTNSYGMDTSLLEEYLDKANQDGIKVFAIVGSAPSTATGVYDDLSAIAKFSKLRNLWFHVDGAHGGAAIFSPKYRNLLAGIEKADSMVIDGHKMMMMPAITTALLYKNGENSHKTFRQKADYLLGQSKDEDWYNLAKRTFECTKTMMGIHWFTLLKTYGEEIFNDNVTRLYDMGQQFGEMIAQEADFELAISPMSNIVCFRYLRPGIDRVALNKLNERIRQKLLEEGRFYIVQTKLRGTHYLRTTIMNPFTTLDHLRELLFSIRDIALDYQSK